MTGKTIPDGELLDDLERVNDEIGKAAKMEQYRRQGNYVPETLISRFGSWREAHKMIDEDIGERNGMRR